MGETPSTRIEASTTPMPLATLKALWPRAAAPDARHLAWQPHDARHRAVRFAQASFRQIPSAGGRRCTGGRPASRSRRRLPTLRWCRCRKAFLSRLPRASIRLENFGPRSDRAGCRLHRLAGAPGADQGGAVHGHLAGVQRPHRRACVPLPDHDCGPQRGSQPARSCICSAQSRCRSTGSMARSTGRSKSPCRSSKAGPPRPRPGARITEIRGKLRAGASSSAAARSTSMSRPSASTPRASSSSTASWRRWRCSASSMRLPICSRRCASPAVLDNADRTQLKFDVNHLIQGEMPIEITIGPGPGRENRSSMRAPISATPTSSSRSLPGGNRPGRTASTRILTSPP